MRRILPLSFILTLLFVGAVGSGLWAQDCISGVVFADDDADGIQDPGEAGYTSADVVAIGPGGTILTTMVNGDGSYEFCDLPEGDWYIYVDLSSPDLLSDPPHYAETFMVGSSIPDRDFGIVNTVELGTIGGVAFHDVNGNGLQDEFEPGLRAGEIVTLLGPGGILQTSQLDAGGRFRFVNLPAGAYVVSIDASFPNTAFSNGGSIDVDLPPAGLVDNLRFDRRPLPGFGSVLDFICYDLNADGENQPETEPGIYGPISVRLLDVNNQEIGTTLPDERGRYIFPGLPPGTYTVEAIYSPEDFTPTTPVIYDLNLDVDGTVFPGPFYYEPRRKRFSCGMAVSTFKGDYDTPWNTGNGGRVVAVKDIRDQTNGFPVQGTSTPWTTVTDIDHPDWRDNKMNQVFGITTDEDLYIYLTATQMFGAASTGIGSNLVMMINPFTAAPTTINIGAAATTPGTNELIGGFRGLGNITYNIDQKVLYVTNLEDANIVVIAAQNHPTDPVGEVLQTYPVTSFTVGQLSGERVWGIGYDPSDGRVYFSSPASGGAVSIISIDTDPNGLLTGVETTRFTLPNMVNVADIAFSSDGSRMMVAERSNPHCSKTYQFNKTGAATWSAPSQFFVGGYLYGCDDNINSSGGVDFSYPSFTGPTPPPGVCDTAIVASGNALILTGGLAVYGFGIIPGGGNSQGSYASLNTIFIDSDNSTVSLGIDNDKGEQGDVEVFDCECAIEDCADANGFEIIPSSPIDPPGVGDCCHLLDFVNTGSLDVYGIGLTLLDGVEFQPGYILAPGLFT
ncbi:MAG: hypothetical protein KDC54_17930, partial [Lewinella sp.]|nr:hypothetical protein [Lewinella sp.]